VEEIPPDNRKLTTANKSSLKNAEYWLACGYKISRKAQTLQDFEIALDNYLTGLRADPNHYACMFNAGAVMMRLSRFSNSQKWF